MSLFYLSDEHYWSRYDGQDIPTEELKINVISDGITRLPIIEGEVSHVEIPRMKMFLGMTLVGGADTPLKCVVVQEVYPNGLIADDGRLQPGDQIIEINGIDIACARHSQICSAIRKMTSVLRLAIYRERMEKYGEHSMTTNFHKRSQNGSKQQQQLENHKHEDGVGDISKHDELLTDNSNNCSISEVLETIELKPSCLCEANWLSEHKIEDASCKDNILVSKEKECEENLMEVEATLLQEIDLMGENQHNCTAEYFMSEPSKKFERSISQSDEYPKKSLVKTICQVQKSFALDFVENLESRNGKMIKSIMKRAFNNDEQSLPHRTVVIKKVEGETLGMRIGGGMGSNEGDTPIYVTNIHPKGCIGKSKLFKKGDILLSVNGNNLCGLTHAQAVATLKSAGNFDSVCFEFTEGPETSQGSSNFVPEWTFWQKLPRNLQYSKTVILHRPECSSWGFSIVGGSDLEESKPKDPIHVLFVVPDSPAKRAHLRCGDRILAVDGHSLENISHKVAVKMLKETKTKVVIDIVSWIGTEL